MSSSTLSATRPSIIGCTEVKVEHFTCKWIIKEFKYLPHSSNISIDSPVFCTVDNDVEWKLSLYPEGLSHMPRRDNNNALFYLHWSQNVNEMRYIFVELSIPNNPVISTSISTYDSRNKSQCFFRTNYAKLLESCDSDNTLTILCQIKLPGPVTSKVIEARKSMKQAFDTQKGQWCQDFRRLLEESKFTDFALLVGTHKFPAHKLVLAARSSVFSAMFAHEETEENLKNEVKIENMEPATIQAMLEFFYTDKVTNLEELAHDLLEAADKYDVPLLRSMCEEVLYATVNAENAAEILILADLHRSPKLKEHVMGFMADHLRHAVESDSYKVMEEVYPSLTKELIRFIAVNK